MLKQSSIINTVQILNLKIIASFFEKFVSTTIWVSVINLCFGEFDLSINQVMFGPFTDLQVNNDYYNLYFYK